LFSSSGAKAKHEWLPTKNSERLLSEAKKTLTLSQSCSVKKIQEEGPLVLLLHPHDLLGDVFGGGANATDGQENVIIQEVAGQHLVEGQR